MILRFIVGAFHALIITGAALGAHHATGNVWWGLVVCCSLFSIRLSAVEAAKLNVKEPTP